MAKFDKHNELLIGGYSYGHCYFWDREGDCGHGKNAVIRTTALQFCGCYDNEEAAVSAAFRDYRARKVSGQAALLEHEQQHGIRRHIRL